MTDGEMREWKSEENKNACKQKKTHTHRFDRGSTLRDLFSSALMVPVELPSVFWKLGHCSSHSACLIRHIARLFYFFYFFFNQLSTSLVSSFLGGGKQRSGIVKSQALFECGCTHIQTCRHTHTNRWNKYCHSGWKQSHTDGQSGWLH